MIDLDALKRFLTKRGYAVRMPSGEYRGVYSDPKTAELIQGIAGVMEFCIFDWPSVVPCRMWLWRRGGARLQPVKS